MLSPNEIKSFFIAVLATFAEYEIDQDFAESTFYLMLNMNLENWNKIKAIMVGADVITVKGYRVKATQKGYELGQRLNKELKTPLT